MTVATEDLYVPSPEVAVIADLHWRYKGKPTGSNLIPFRADMLHMQQALLAHYYPIMDEATAHRAAQTAEHLDILLRTPKRIPPYRPLPLETSRG